MGRLGSSITHIATRIEKGLPLKMEGCTPVQTMSVARAESLMEQSSILLEMCGNSEIIPLAQENLAPPIQCLEPVDVLEYQVVQESEHVRDEQQSEEIVWAVEDPELIRLAEECSVGNTFNTWIEENPSAGEQNPNFEDLLIRDNRQSQDELEDAEWVPHQEEQNQKSSLSTSKSRMNMKNKHRKGRSRKPLEEIDDKAKQKNVVRCRNYRSEKKVREEKKLTDLQELEKRNLELKRKEVEVRGKREKVQNAYLALIKYGRIKFAFGF